MKLSHRSFKTPSNRSLEITMVSSNYHVEINPADVGSGDRFVVQEVIKEMAQSGALNKSSSSLASKPKAGFKVVVLTEVDRLTREAQAALRRTMELYTSSCRLILICESASRVIEPVRSRCLSLRIASPTQPEVMSVLSDIASKEKIELPKAFAAKVARASDRNLRRAILMLEASKVQSYPFTPTQVPQAMDWQRYIDTLAGDVVISQSPQALLAARSKLYQLLINCIPPDVILNNLCMRLVDKAPNDFARHELVAWATAFEARLRYGSKAVFHLEAYLARAMQVIKHVHLTAAASSSAAVSSSSASAGVIEIE
jgi:replication factor C subunit 3/5